MGTAVPVEPWEGKKYKTLFSTMKAFVAVAMAAAAQAAPEADPQLLLANPVVYGTAHTQTLGMVHHANGAVVPDDTLSVKAAKVDHLNAKATAYLNKPIVPVVQTVAAKPVVQTVASPVVSYSGLYNPYGLLNTHLFKREAEAEAEAEADPLTVYHGVQAPPYLHWYVQLPAPSCRQDRCPNCRQDRCPNCCQDYRQDPRCLLWPQLRPQLWPELPSCVQHPPHQA